MVSLANFCNCNFLYHKYKLGIDGKKRLKKYILFFLDTPDELLEYPFRSDDISSDLCNASEETSDIMTEIITDDIQSLSDHTHNTSISMDIEMEGVE